MVLATDYSLNHPVVRDIYDNLLSIYGDLQVDVAIEEMSELTKALIKNRRRLNSGEFNRADQLEAGRWDIIEELADVQIMIDQVRRLYCTDGEFEDKIREKQRRLNHMLAEQGVVIHA